MLCNYVINTILLEIHIHNVKGLFKHFSHVYGNFFYTVVHR
jgi:hypothetical protein